MQTSTREQLYQQIIEHAADAIIAADRAGTIHLWNAGAEIMFGYTAEEAMGKTLDLIIPERLRGRHWEGYRKVMETGVTRYGRNLLAVPGIRKDGTRISIEFSIALLGNRTGVEGAVAVIRDVSARWNEQKELRRRLAEAEGKS